MDNWLASVWRWNGRLKSGYARIGVEHNRDFNTWKAVSQSELHSKTTPFRVKCCKGKAILANPLQNGDNNCTGRENCEDLIQWLELETTGRFEAFLDQGKYQKKLRHTQEIHGIPSEKKFGWFQLNGGETDAPQMSWKKWLYHRYRSSRFFTLSHGVLLTSDAGN